jgi:hypothetical protein
LPEPEELQAEVGTILVVGRYLPGPRQQPEGGIESASEFDEALREVLVERMDVIRAVLGDVLGPDYEVSKLTIETTRSVEVVAVVAVAYHVVKNFTEVVETLGRARDQMVAIVRWLAHRTPGPLPFSDYIVTGRVVTVAADVFASASMQIPLGYSPSVIEASPSRVDPRSLVPVVRKATDAPKPVKWDWDTFLSRLIVPLVFLLGIAGLVVGLIAAFRHI